MTPASKRLSSVILFLTAFLAILLCTAVIRHEDVGSYKDRRAVSLLHQDLVADPVNAIIASSEKKPTIVCSTDKDSLPGVQCEDIDCHAVNGGSR